MKSRALLLFMLVLIMSAAVSACGNSENTAQTPTAGETNTPSGVIATIVSVPDPGTAARAYLDAWTNFDYVAMYNMLTTISRDSITIENFNSPMRVAFDDLSWVPTKAPVNILRFASMATFLYQITLLCHSQSLLGPPCVPRPS